MASYAVIEDGRVTNVVEAEASFAEENGWVELTGGAGTGWLWDGEAFSAPPPSPLPPQLRRVTVLAFRNRFTQAEKVAIDLASIDDPAASMSVRQQQAAIRVSLADMAVATYIDLDRPDTRAGVTMLEEGNILAAGRALQILDADILDSERPQ